MKPVFRKILTAFRILGIYFSRRPNIFSIPEQHMSLRDLDVVIHAHIYHGCYLKKLEKGIKHFPDSVFLVSVPNSELKQKVQEIFQKRQKQNVKVEIVPNLGRNFGPMFNVFSEEILSHEILIHIHSKASNGMLFRVFWSHIVWRDLYLSKKLVPIQKES